MPNLKLELRYKRLPEKVEGNSVFRGSLSIVDADTATSYHDEAFIQLTYKRLIALLNSSLNRYPDVSDITFLRTEREGLIPVELGARLIDLIRTDPLAAYRAMSYDAPNVGINSRNLDCSAEAARFSELLYLPMRNGEVEDPETGTYRPLAYGSKQGWRIRRDDSKSGGWIRINLMDGSPEGTSLGEKMAFAQWATVTVYDLIAQQLEKYYLPRPWNTDGPWITYEELKKRLDKYLAEKEKASNDR